MSLDSSSANSATNAVGSLVQQGSMSTNDAVKTLVAEREFRSELKSGITSVVTKLDEMNKKVDEIRSSS